MASPPRHRTDVWAIKNLCGPKRQRGEVIERVYSFTAATLATPFTLCRFVQARATQINGLAPLWWNFCKIMCRCCLQRNDSPALKTFACSHQPAVIFLTITRFSSRRGAGSQARPHQFHQAPGGHDFGLSVTVRRSLALAIGHNRDQSDRFRPCYYGSDCPSGHNVQQA